MSREIKLRAWDTETKEMSYDFLDRNWLLVCIESPFVEIMQFTGLKDKNGKEIYERDILECKNHWGNTEIIWFNAGFRGKYIDHKDQICYAMIASAPSDGIEVIGNIYENPELLEVNS